MQRDLEQDGSSGYFHFVLAPFCSTTYFVFGPMYFRSLSISVISQFTELYHRFNLIQMSIIMINDRKSSNMCLQTVLTDEVSSSDTFSV